MSSFSEERVSVNNNLQFIVDTNVGKLAKWLRMLGYNTLFFDDGDDSRMITMALKENRIIITRDTQIVLRRVVAIGMLRVILITSDQPQQQIQQVVDTLKLDYETRAFSLCLECNQLLEERTKQQVKDRVPPYVFQTQDKYVECPACQRIYWKGTHWQAMTKKLDKLRR